MAKQENLAERLSLAKTLLRIKPDELSLPELDACAGLLIGETMKIDDEVAFRKTDDGSWVRFSPTEDWNDYGMLVSKYEFVTSSHAEYDDPDNSERKTGYWFSCHSFMSGVKTDGTDLRETVCTTAAKRLNYDVKYSEEWQTEEIESPRKSTVKP